MLFDDVQRETVRVKDLCSRLSAENQMIRREIDELSAETYEVRKECDYSASRNLDMGSQVRELEIRIKDKED